eukprot:3818823-Prymnesium_polylepis.2
MGRSALLARRQMQTRPLVVVRHVHADPTRQHQRQFLDTALPCPLRASKEHAQHVTLVCATSGCSASIRAPHTSQSSHAEPASVYPSTPPLRLSIRATSTCPSRTASRRAVPPHRSFAFMSAPSSIRFATMGKFPSLAARCRHVRAS